MHIAVLGHYRHRGPSHEVYVHTIPRYIHSRLHKNLGEAAFSFYDIDDPELNLYKKDAVIVGGGTFNEESLRRLSFLSSFRGVKIALSIGLAKSELISPLFLSLFDFVFTNVFEDLRPLQKALGTEKAHFLPDLSFNLSPVFQPSQGNKLCGVFLSSRLPSDMYKDVARALEHLSTRFAVTFYLFDDAPVKQVAELVDRPVVVDDTSHNAAKLFEIMSHLDLAVCMPYHAHVMCMLSGVPVISLTDERPVVALMAQAGLSDSQCLLTEDDLYTELKRAARHVYKEREEIARSLPRVIKRLRFQLNTDKISGLINGRMAKTVADEVLNYMGDDPVTIGQIISGRISTCPDHPFAATIAQRWSPEAMSQLIAEAKDKCPPPESAFRFVYYAPNEMIEECTKNGLFNFNIDEYYALSQDRWWLVAEAMTEMISDQGIFLDLMLERTFVQCHGYMAYTGRIPYTQPWAGFLHQVETQQIWSDNDFLRSLLTCRALFTFTPSPWIQKVLQDLHFDIPIVTVTYPGKATSCFSLEEYRKNPRVVAMSGFWIYAFESYVGQPTILRSHHPSQISVVYSDDPPEQNGTDWMNGLVLWLHDHGISAQCSDDTLYVPLSTDLEEVRTILHGLMGNVDIIPNPKDYIVYLHTEDFDPIIVECIMTNTPIIINRTAMSLHYLGSDYPLWSDDLVTPEKVSMAFHYLQDLDKTRFNFSVFAETVVGALS